MQPVYEFWAMYNSNRKFFMENFNGKIFNKCQGMFVQNVKDGPNAVLN